MSFNKSTQPAQDCDAILELIPDYAFGLSDAGETRLVKANLASCLEAAAELADYQRLQEEMRASVPQMRPPPQLEARLMAAIATPQTPAVPRRVSTWAVLAAVALMALVVTNVFWLARMNDLARRQDELAAQLAQMNASPNNAAFVLTSTSDLRWVRLPPAEQNVDAGAFLMWNAESKIGVLYVSGFPKLATGKTYQLWLTRGEERVSAGTFRVDEEGKGALLFNVTEAIDQFTWARITDEPESGSQQPTGPVVVNGQL